MKQYFSPLKEFSSGILSFEAHITKDQCRDHIVRVISGAQEDLKKQGFKVLKGHCDRGGEFRLEEFVQWCRAQNVEFVGSSPSNQYQDPAERAIGFLQTNSRAVFLTMKIPTVFWSLIHKAVAYVLNRTCQSRDPTRTPHEIYHSATQPWHLQYPDQSPLRILGCDATCFIDQELRIRAEKGEARGKPSRLMGYEGNHIYVMWTIDDGTKYGGGRIFHTSHVIFHENVGHPDMAPDPRFIVRSLPAWIQRRLRARKPPKSKIRMIDNNVVEEDVMDADRNLHEKPGPKQQRPWGTYFAGSEHEDVLAEMQLIQQEARRNGISITTHQMFDETLGNFMAGLINEDVPTLRT